MAVTETIQEILQGIDDAQYGRDMRQYIHKGIQKCYEEGSAGETDLVARNDIADILNNFGSVENTSTASKAYTVGEWLIYENVLYYVTTAIAQGDTLSEGTNIIPQTISSALEDTIQNMNKWYMLPANVPTIANLTTQVRLLINPVQKLMDVNIYIQASESVSSPGNIVTQLPVMPYYNASKRNYRYFTLHGEMTSDFISHANIYSTDISGDPEDPNYHSVISVRTTISSGIGIYGHIIVPYTKLCDAHPFSEAVLVEN